MVAFTAGAVLTAANLNTAFNALTIRAVTGTSDTFVLADNGGAVSYSNASPITATVPPFSSVAYANGTVIELLNLGAGVVTVTAGVGVTLNGSSVAIAQNTGGTLIKTATNTWYFLPSSTGSGMDLITPTSVAGSGVTLTGPVVSFSAATSITVNGCFTTTYNNYLIVATGVMTQNSFLLMRMALAGVEASTNVYYRQRLTANSTTISGSAATSTSGAVASWDTSKSNLSLYVFNPAVTEPTTWQSNSWAYPVSTIDLFSGLHDVSTAYDGVKLFMASGNLTGSLRIYGLRNS